MNEGAPAVSDADLGESASLPLLTKGDYTRRIDNIVQEAATPSPELLATQVVLFDYEVAMSSFTACLKAGNQHDSPQGPKFCKDSLHAGLLEAEDEGVSIEVMD